MSAREAPPLLELVGVERRFALGDGEVVVLKGIDLRIRRGELLAITGQSGSGKSTLMNILGCLDRPSSGSYRIDGQEMRTLDGDALARLRREHFGFIFQRYHLLPHLSAEENVQIPAIYSGAARQARLARARALLARLGLAERSAYPPAKLSGGQQQRVSIARALMNGGEVILADEPTGALDTRSGREVMNILLELNAIGHTVILVTHDRNVAAHARRVVEINDGEIVADRLRDETANPAQDETENEPATPLAALPGDAAPMPPPPARGGADSIHAGSLGAAFRIAWIAMITHRLRTLLTMLGIVIGIAAVITVVALGQGAQRSVVAAIEAIGTNTIDLSPGRDWGDENARSIHTLSAADAAALRAQFYVDSATPLVASSQTLQHANVKASASVRGVGEDYFRVHGTRFAQGERFDASQVLRRAQVVVIDDNTRQRLFRSWEQPIGQIILVGSLPCTVIGVTARNDGLFGPRTDLEVFIPYTTAADRLTGQSWLNGITVRIRDGVPNGIAEQNITKLMSSRHGIKDFFTNSSDSIVQTVQRTTGTLTLLILSVAVVSLLVGGIGVMNIMLVSVTERTHEIGIRMAVGARQSDVMQQFLIEAVLICVVGGLFGVLLSFAVSGAFSLFVKIIVMRFSLLAMLVACLCSTLIGVAFGFWPARNAARLDPIDALARE
ncbi:MacB family efflux pump subunit [Burkholderia gladioli]|uniref:MacB family efflux pump subunit n=1 Tax=Burkholderia gladioli TaxID=28095 RepID=UPI001364C396|nr:MacB family efflux pump subunit [Burkholderia gladioli]KAF1061943.1 Macrolide export ATP-binding/permease protein MacB [Burkholderia gladioli]WAG18290.1 MacB family efflux pump subunit [Burkholderia gladioli]